MGDSADTPPTSGTEPTEPKIQDALDRSVRNTLVPLSASVGLLFAFFAVTDWISMAPSEARYIASYDAAVAGILLGGAATMHRWTPPTHRANSLVAAIAGLITLFGALVMTVRPYPIESIVFIMLVLGSGVVLLSFRWLAAVTAASLASWLWFALTGPASPDWVQYGQALVTSAVLAAIVLHVRRQALRRAEHSRILEKRARMRLQEAVSETERNRAALEEAQRVAHIGNWTWDIAQNSVTWSDELYRLFGLAPRSVVVSYEGFLARVHPDDRSKVEARVGHALKTYDPFEFDHRVALPDGSVRWLHSRGFVLLDEKGFPVRMVGTGQDIEDRKRAEREEREAEANLGEVNRLRAVDAFKSQFINEAAHELNTPLTPIMIQLELLKMHEGPKLTTAQRRSLLVIERNVARFGVLVADLLDSARLQARQMRIHSESVDLVQLVRDGVDSFEAMARNEQIALDVRLPASLRVKADGARISQVVYNLLSNALKYTHRGGRIEVHAAGNAETATVSVRDTGIGIGRDAMPKLFQPFSQVHDPAAVKVTGTGLGLYVSRGIVELHQGRIWCESEGPGRGATFSFTIPRDAAARPSADEASQEPKKEARIVAIGTA